MRPFIIDAEKAILLVVDVQEKLIPLVADSEPWRTGSPSSPGRPRCSTFPSR